MHRAYSIPLPDERVLSLGKTPTMMGILNVTPDSFSDGGHFTMVEAALAQAQQMIAEGADLIDIGGESTRPGASPVSAQEELDRVLPVIDALIAAGVTAPISIDTYKPLVADQAIQAGAAIVNDVHGLQRDPDMAAVVALHDVPIIVMHWDPDRNTSPPILGEVRSYFERSFAIADAAGIDRAKLIVDPGFGFSKSLAANYELLNSIRKDAVLDMPLLIGTSRKSMIGKLLGNDPADRLAGTIATNVLAYSGGAHIFRVHDVKANRDALRIATATLYGLPNEVG